MEEKERYIIEDDDYGLEKIIVDNETGNAYYQDNLDWTKLCKLLNQQDEEIKLWKDAMILACREIYNCWDKDMNKMPWEILDYYLKKAKE